MGKTESPYHHPPTVPTLKLGVLLYHGEAEGLQKYPCHSTNELHYTFERDPKNFISHLCHSFGLPTRVDSVKQFKFTDLTPCEFNGRFDLQMKSIYSMTHMKYKFIRRGLITALWDSLRLFILFLRSSFSRCGYTPRGTKHCCSFEFST